MIDEADIAVSPEKATAPSVAALGAPATREFIRYFAASALALLIDTGALFVLTSFLAVPYLISGAIAFLLGLVTVYLLSVRWVFEERAMKDKRAEFALFAIIGVVGLLLNEAALALLTGIFGLYYLLSKGASVIIVFSWNFFARKHLLFRARR